MAVRAAVYAAMPVEPGPADEALARARAEQAVAQLTPPPAEGDRLRLVEDVSDRIVAREVDRRWVRRDLWMTLPRLAGFGACLWLLGFERRRWSFFSLSGLALACAACAAFATLNFCRSLFFTPPLAQRLAVVAATIAVALFEEAAFRGALLEALSLLFSPRWAVFWSAAAFALYHVQALPAFSLPFVFLFGLAAAGSRALGLGLAWLAGLHLIVDAIPALRGAPGFFDRPWLFLAAAAALAGCAASALWLTPGVQWSHEEAKDLDGRRARS